MGGVLNAQGVLVGLNQPEPPEGRKMITFPPFYFTVGTEVYYWDTTQLGNQKISSIVAAWIDVANLNLGQSTGAINELVIAIGAAKGNSVRPAANSVAYPNMVIRANNPLTAAAQNRSYPTDKTPQGFYIIPSQAPFSMQVSGNFGGTITPQPPPGNYAAIILYNFNPLLTGYGVHPPKVSQHPATATKG